MMLVEKHPSLHGRQLASPEDGGLLNLVADYFKALWLGKDVTYEKDAPTIAPLKASTVVEALRQEVWQYRECAIRFESVEVGQLRPLTKYLENFKLFRVGALEKLLSEQGIENAAIVIGSPWPVTPPVVERLSNGAMIVVDGAHRIFKALSSGRREMRVIVVDNSTELLPAIPFEDWNHIEIAVAKKPRLERYNGYKEKQFRDIRRAFRTLAALSPSRSEQSKG
jgi:hypothetical protein